MSQAPDSQAPDFQAPDFHAPEAQASDSHAPGPEAPDSPAPQDDNAAAHHDVKPDSEANKQALLDAIFATATDYAIITFDAQGRIATWNTGAELVFGYRVSEAVGCPSALLFTDEDRRDGVPDLEMDVARDTGRSADYRWHRRKDGGRFWADGVMTPIRTPDRTVSGFLKIMRDATEKKHAEQELLSMAKLDGLTGLANRSSCMARLQELTATALRNKKPLVVLLLDLDKFKDINDRWGHPAGDQLLCQAVQRMRNSTRDTDFIARLGGDEFVILQPDAQSPHDGAMLADKLVASLARPYAIDGNEVVSGASIGITVFPSDGSDTALLLHNADLAMYQAKKNGGGAYHYFTEQMDREAHQRSGDRGRLRQAVAHDAMRLVYQPEIDAASGRTVAVEALLRFTDPALAQRPLGDMVQLAMDTGLMVQIGNWVMREACAQLRRWRDAGLPPVRMCVNLCARELLNRDLSDEIADRLAERGLEGRDLEVEITERELLEHESRGVPTLRAVRELGVSVAIDDFGTGYSSLSYLRHLPVDRIKLDRSFLAEIPGDPDSCAIASAIVNLAHTLHLDMVVEGVESAEQAHFFRHAHSELLQGYYFSHPLDSEQMGSWLGQQAQPA